MRALFVALLCTLIFGASVNPASAIDRNIGHWNMQGKCAQGESKWVMALPNLMAGTVTVGDLTINVGIPMDVLALQEAGLPPIAGTRPVPAGMRPPVQRNGAIAPEFFTWRPGSRFEEHHLYFLRTDPTGRRCNLAIMTRERANLVITLPPPLGRGREILGVRIGDDFYFDIHARSGVRGAAFENVRAIYDFMAANYRGQEFRILGDFNEEPSVLQDDIARFGAIANNVTVVFNNRATHQVGRTLDYGVFGRVPMANQPVWNQPQVQPTPTPGIANVGPSDHWPVLYYKEGL